LQGQKVSLDSSDTVDDNLCKATKYDGKIKHHWGILAAASSPENNNNITVREALCEQNKMELSGRNADLSADRVLVYSLVPVSASAQSVSTGNEDTSINNGETTAQHSLPKQSAIYYQPPHTSENQIIGPSSQEDQAPSPIPPKDDVEFSAGSRVDQ